MLGGTGGEFTCRKSTFTLGRRVGVRTRRELRLVERGRRAIGRRDRATDLQVMVPTGFHLEMVGPQEHLRVVVRYGDVAQPIDFGQSIRQEQIGLEGGAVVNVERGEQARVVRPGAIFSGLFGGRRRAIAGRRVGVRTAVGGASILGPAAARVVRSPVATHLETGRAGSRSAEVPAVAGVARTGTTGAGTA
jgi:hypothetical protein